MKRPFDSVRESLLEVIKQHKDNSRQLLEQIDKLMLWIVGFSIGGLSLIVSDLAKLNESFCYYVLKWILILLTLSIVSGIIFRIACYFIQVYNNQIQVFVEAAFSDKEFMEIEPEDLSDETNITEIIRRLKVDYGEEATHILNEYSQVDLSDETNQTYLLDDLKIHYKTIGEWAKKDYELAIEFAKDTMKKAYGLSDKQINLVKNDKTSSKWQFWIWTAYISFLTSCLSFVTVIVMLCILY